ncbi:unnamed protein product, partial [Rotaria sp. Silwood2]
LRKKCLSLHESGKLNKIFDEPRSLEKRSVSPICELSFQTLTAIGNDL